MNEKITCFRCRYVFDVDENAIMMVCPRCGTGMQRNFAEPEPIQTPEAPKEEVKEEVVDEIVIDSVIEDKPGRRNKKMKDSFDAAPSLDEE